MNSSIDWRTLPAGRDLDKLIAKRLGYTLQGGQPIREDMRQYAGVTGWWIVKDGGMRMLPDYSIDANAAFELLKGVWWQIESHNREMVVCYVCDHFTESLWERSSAIETTPALAICRAWLDWRGRQR